MTIEIMIATLGDAMLRTFAIFFLTLLGALPLGMLVAFGRMSKYKIISYPVKAYISVMRGTPLMLQLMVVFFCPFYLFGIRTGGDYRFIAVIIGFVLNYAAYFAEIYRGGIESMPKGQYEAADVLGFTKGQTFLRIILPQVSKNILPSVTNEIITLVKDTSLAFAISYAEMFTMAKKIASSQGTLTPFIIAGIFYYVFNLLVEIVMARGEKSMAYYR